MDAKRKNKMQNDKKRWDCPDCLDESIYIDH